MPDQYGPTQSSEEQDRRAAQNLANAARGARGSDAKRVWIAPPASHSSRA